MSPAVTTDPTVYVADARELVSTTAVRSDGSRVDIKDFFGPASVPPPA